MLGCLILLLLLVIFEGAFIGFNLENVCNVWLFKDYEAVPVYITVIISFAAGVVLATLLLAFGRLTKRMRARAKSHAALAEEALKEKKRQERLNRKETRAAASAAPSSHSHFRGITAISDKSSSGVDSYGGGFKGNIKEEN